LKLEDAVKALKELPPSKISIALGALTASVAVIQFREDMVLMVVLFVTGAVLVITGLVMGVLRRRADIKYRQWLIKEGKPVKDDKTVIKFD